MFIYVYAMDRMFGLRFEVVGSIMVLIESVLHVIYA